MDSLLFSIIYIFGLYCSLGTLCNPGTYSSSASSSCVACPSGKYSTSSGSSECISFTNGVTNSNRPSNYVTVYDHNYATLANTVPGTNGSLCQQNTYLALPVGWIVAPNNCQSWFALGCNYWQTSRIVMMDGTSYYSKASSQQQPWSFGGFSLINSDGQYSVTSCNTEILITDDVNAVYSPCPSNPTSCTLCGPGYYSVNGAAPCKLHLYLYVHR